MLILTLMPSSKSMTSSGRFLDKQKGYLETIYTSESFKKPVGSGGSKSTLALKAASPTDMYSSHPLWIRLKHRYSQHRWKLSTALGHVWRVLQLPRLRTCGHQSDVKL